MKAATKIDHPMSPKKVLPDPLKVVLFDNLTMDPVDLAKSRMRTVVTIGAMAKDLEQEECKVKAAYPRRSKKSSAPSASPCGKRFLKRPVFQTWT